MPELTTEELETTELELLTVEELETAELELALAELPADDELETAELELLTAEELETTELPINEELFEVPSLDGSESELLLPFPSGSSLELVEEQLNRRRTVGKSKPEKS